MAKKSGKEQYWKKELERFKASGQTKASFARRRGYSSWSLTLWERKFKPERAGFAAVTIRPMEIRPETVRIRLRGMELEGVPPVAWMAELLRAMEGSRT